jgi:superfamily I DNA/RNA helicase
MGYDYVFVDETQLFNENERRVLPLLTKGNTAHVPIALALDEAQQLYGQSSAGLATIGIKDITSESLPSIHRSTRAIVKLAFFVVQRCTELFSADFPDFTKIADEMAPDSHPLAIPPRFEIVKSGATGLPAAIEQRVRSLRRTIRQIAIICHSDQYWAPILAMLERSNLPLYVIERRGAKLPADQPIVVLTRPEHVGGQEFDAVILVGLEQGVVPPRVTGNDALAAAIEQQALREIYLAVTRARFQIFIMLPRRASPTPVLRDAAKSGLIESEGASGKED